LVIGQHVIAEVDSADRLFAVIGGHERIGTEAVGSASWSNEAIVSLSQGRALACERRGIPGGHFRRLPAHSAYDPFEDRRHEATQDGACRTPPTLK
jgi:hypothetical protein